MDEAVSVKVIHATEDLTRRSSATCDMRALVVVMVLALVTAPLMAEAQRVLGDRRDYDRGYEYEMGRRDGYEDARDRNYDTYRRGRGSYDMGYEYGRGQRDGYEEGRERFNTNRRDRGNGVGRG
ncbi:uncharacterized protein LOC126187560 isoform X2 [Schistocerca cancellata]|uniref:uncharacterized protein LOC126187560 isoform X2 n=1 Tax=Schistocerca cancellata TaxID=274614 RepID=UPI0021192458|nr:uncharacterized protein LOC126187560 isoform X2 [Schistocerca cancellata]